MTDLSLVPLKDLIGEIEKRCDYYVLGLTKTQEGNIPVVSTYWSGEHWVREVGLAEILKNDILTEFDTEREFED